MKFLCIYLLLIFIILFFSYKNSFILVKKESFHPVIRQWYRPIIRKTRIYSSNWFQKLKDRLLLFWRKTLLLK